MGQDPLPFKGAAMGSDLWGRTPPTKGAVMGVRVRSMGQDPLPFKGAATGSDLWGRTPSHPSPYSLKGVAMGLDLWGRTPSPLKGQLRDQIYGAGPPPIPPYIALKGQRWGRIYGAGPPLTSPSPLSPPLPQVLVLMTLLGTPPATTGTPPVAVDPPLAVVGPPMGLGGGGRPPCRPINVTVAVEKDECPQCMAVTTTACGGYCRTRVGGNGGGE